MDDNTKAPEWKVVIALVDEAGNVKLTKEIPAPRVEKSMPYTIGKTEAGAQKSARPKCLEWNVNELFKAVKADGSAAKINGKDAGFEVKAVVRFSDYEVQLASKGRTKEAAVAAKIEAEL